MPIYINRTNAGKSQMPQAGFEPTTEIPKQPQWSKSNISYKGTSIARHLLPDLSSWELLLLIVETKLIGPGARFSKLPVITGLVKLFCFPFQMGVSKLLKINSKVFS